MTNYQEYFNGAVSAKSLATVDKEGNPNVCLCGSAYMLDEKTIVAACGFFDRTRKNVEETGKAVFLAFQPLKAEYWAHYEKTGEHLFAPGIRFHCTLRETATQGPILQRIQKSLSARVGNRVADGLEFLWVFDICETRELDF